jgi:hypothetical protein
MPNAVRYRSQSHDGPSYNLWHDFPEEGVYDKSVAYGFHEDFSSGGLITSPTTSAALVGTNFSGFGSTGSTITYSDELGGGVELGSDGTDNDATSIFSLSHCFQMGLTKQPIWFECSIKPNALLTTETGFFVGLADSTAKTATVPLVDALAEVADLNCVGFNALDTDIGEVQHGYRSDGVAGVTVGTSTDTPMVEGTYTKLGFKKDSGGLVRWFIDGVQVGTFQTINDLGTGFPGDVQLAPIVAMKVGAATGAQTLNCRFVRCYQLRV